MDINNNNRLQKYLPGQLIEEKELGSSTLGPGIYRQGNCLYASLSGYLRQECRLLNEDDDKPTNVISIELASSSSSSRVPRIGQTCWGKVVRVTSKYATVAISILLEDGLVTLKDPYKGTIRQQDVMSRDSDDQQAATSASAASATVMLPITSAFRPGDVVRARVVGLGDAASGGYFLSTSLDPADGVVYARSSASGVPMVPVAWNEMQCPQTGVRERRKVAKPCEK